MSLPNVITQTQPGEMFIQRTVAKLVRNTDINLPGILQAWQDEQRPHLHGWVYRLGDGIIKPTCEMDYNDEIDPV